MNIGRIIFDALLDRVIQRGPIFFHLGVDLVGQSVDLVLHHLFFGIFLQLLNVFENHLDSIFLGLVENKFTTDLYFLFHKRLLNIYDFC